MAENGDVVKVEYTGKLQDGSVFDSNVGGSPLEFTVGAGQMITGFDAAVVGMKVGDTKTVVLPPDQAYGERSEEMVITVERSQIPATITPVVGDKLYMSTTTGQQVPVTIIEVTDEYVKLDANHELAGKTLVFDIKMLEITKAE